MDKLDEIFKLQFDQQLDMRWPCPADDDDYLRDMSLYLIQEVIDFLDSRKYKKHHLRGEQLHRATQIYELIDIQKYLLAMTIALDVTPTEWRDYFESKTAVVADKWRQENADLSGNVIACDIDDVLTEFQLAVSNLEPEWNVDEVLEETSFYADLFPKSSNIQALQELAKHSKIVLMTSRKAYRSKLIEVHTIEWLNANDVPYSVILWGHDKAENIKKLGVSPLFVIENSVKHAIDFADQNYQVYFVKNGAKSVDHPQIIGIESLWEIAETRGAYV